MQNRRKPMVNSRTAPLTVGALAALLGASSCLLADPQDEPAALVSRLPTNKAALPDVELEKRIAALGARALPALERELRVGIRFKDLDQLFKSSGSRRWAVVRVLSQIPGNASTELLVKSLSDPPDCYQMTEDSLKALSKRTLSNDQIVRMLGNREPRVVLAGIEHAVENMADPDIKAAVERVFNKDTAKAQFRNEHGKPTANDDTLWNVRHSAGRALKRDRVPEMRARAKALLAELRREALHPTKPDEPAWPSSASQAEVTIGRCLNRLSKLGSPVRDLVEAAAKDAEGDHARVLDMALARLGDQARVAKVADHLIASESHTVRYCAAITLRLLRDRSSIPALRKALRDPYQRERGSCIAPREMVYPVRAVAAGALVDLGEDPKETRKEMRK